ncbi:MAG: glycosyl transferase [Lachnospiraceae bacterium]|nr:glycosyl transferase [Lachnospiraceae bacterium]
MKRNMNLIMKENKIKVIVNYLPQFHSIPENDRWWGKGFTDWYATKEAKPLYKGHKQPRIPKDNNYYDLSDVNTLKWQAHLAKRYGIYGFGIYHYWFNSNMKLLEKPSELLLANKDIDINFLFIWDNTSWSRTWKKIKFSIDMSPKYSVGNKEKNNTNGDDGVLAKLEYGTKSDWKKHFDYLLQFFNDKRYIKINRKPVFIVFNPHNEVDVLNNMFTYWDELAKKNGFDGIFVIGKKNIRHAKISDFEVDYEPAVSLISSDKLLMKIYMKFMRKFNNKFHKLNLYDYDKVWKRVLKRAKSERKKTVFYSGFVTFDDTPRRGEQAIIIQNSNPDKFERYFYQLLKLSKLHKKEFVFLTAWNEWGEGAYLEPDEEYEYAYLEAVKKVIEKINN